MASASNSDILDFAKLHFTAAKKAKQKLYVSEFLSGLIV